MLTLVRFYSCLLNIHPTAYCRRVLIALLLTGLTACGQIPRQGNIIAEVDKLIAQQDYGRAERLLASIDNADTQIDTDMRVLVERRQRALPPLIDSLERQTLTQVERLTEQNQWQEALVLVEQAIKQLPRTTRLLTTKDELLIGRQAYMQQLALRSDLLLAEQLAARNTIAQQMLAADPSSWSMRWQLKRQQKQAADLAGELLDCVDQALAAEKVELAERCLVAATKVASAAQQGRLQESRARLARVANAAITAPVAGKAWSERQQRLARLKRDYQGALAAAKWLSAQQQMRQLQALAATDREVIQWQSELQAAIRQQVELGIQKGQALYSQGQIQQALDIWRDTARLDPTHQILQGHINRAERFLGKLQRLDS